MMEAAEEHVRNNAGINPISVQENKNNIADPDDLHEVQVDDDLNEPDAEADYAPGPGADDNQPEDSTPASDQD
jgi:hypothetical protein